METPGLSEEQKQKHQEVRSPTLYEQPFFTSSHAINERQYLITCWQRYPIASCWRNPNNHRRLHLCHNNSTKAR